VTQSFGRAVQKN